jgi:hypothetical protein
MDAPAITIAAAAMATITDRTRIVWVREPATDPGEMMTNATV